MEDDNPSRAKQPSPLQPVEMDEEQSMIADTSIESASTFSAIATPPARAQLDLLAKDPPIGTGFVPASVDTIQKRVGSLRRAKGNVDIDYTFRSIFGKTEYKGKQREIMDAAVRALDILAVAPTGMGKSLCFQVPAVAEEHGLTVVVTPLLSLMDDQVRNLHKLGIKAAKLTSKMSEEDRRHVEKDMLCGHPRNRLLYITPERLAGRPFREQLNKVYRNGELARLVVDEAHCISEWGHDFRQEYARIGDFRKDFPKVPIMALTASATRAVQDDIIISLDMRIDLLYRPIHSFNRNNLFYEVRYTQDGFGARLEDVASFIQATYRRNHKRQPNLTEDEARAVSGIIYCRSKKNCDAVADSLRKKGINAAAFHRGLKDYENDKNASLWQNAAELAREGRKRVDCIVATVAFGMGIDAPACRYVIHFDLPTSFEGFYQETGRVRQSDSSLQPPTLLRLMYAFSKAGRDGSASRCILYYSRHDAAAVRHLSEKATARRAKKPLPDHVKTGPKTSLEALLEYCENVEKCRHISICQYFGERPAAKDQNQYCNRFCDVCKDPAGTAAQRAKLDPPELVATQMPVIRQNAEAEISDSERTPSGSRRGSGATARTLSREDASDDTITSDARLPTGDTLPGFAKASSHLKRSRPEEDARQDMPWEDLRGSYLEPGTATDTNDELLDFDLPPPLPRDGGSYGRGRDYGDGQEPGVRTSRNPPAFVLQDHPSDFAISTGLLDAESSFASDDGCQPIWVPRKRPRSRLSTIYSVSDEGADSTVDCSLIKQSVERPISDDESHSAQRLSDDTAKTSSRTLSGRSTPGKSPAHQPTTKSVLGDLQVTTKSTPMYGSVRVTSKSNQMGDLQIGSNKTGLSGAIDSRQNPGNASTSAPRVRPIDLSGDDSEGGLVRIPKPSSQIKFVLSPGSTTKEIPRSTREHAVRQFHSLLQRAFLASGGLRAKSEEDELFEKIAPSSSAPVPTSVRADMPLFIALELEEDIFWVSKTQEGHRMKAKRMASGLSKMTNTHQWIEGFPSDAMSNNAGDDPAVQTAFRATLRAYKFRRLHERQQDKFSDPSGSDDDNHHNEGSWLR